MAKKRLTPEQELEYHLTYGKDCYYCGHIHCEKFSVSELGNYTQITYKCKSCGKLQDTLYNTTKYKEAIEKIGTR